MKRIAFLVSGGDAPGINACLAGIATAAEQQGLQTLAVPSGFDGLIDGHFVEMSIPWLRTASYGGSPIPTARSSRFREAESQSLAVEKMRQAGIDGLVILGGDGSAHAARALAELGVRSVCVPVTIDNDIRGTDYTVGFDTAVQQIHMILLGMQETANAYRGRVFFVETLGGPTGHLALAGGLAGGADLILVPELHPTPAAVAERVKTLLDSGRDHIVIAGCEGLFETYRPGDQGAAIIYGKEIERLTGVRTRITIMGYFMRGSAPTAFDSLLGQVLGARAVDLLQDGQANRLVVFRNNCVGSIDLAKLIDKKKPLNSDQMALAKARGCLVP
jgi:6-phosphofructokinase 1